MKFFFLLSLLFTVSFSSARTVLPPHLNHEYQNPVKRNAIHWDDLELYSVYTLATDITYSDSRGRSVVFKAGSPFRYKDRIPLPEIRAIYFEFIHQKCPTPKLKIDIFIFENLGVTVEPECVLGLYIEASDYYTSSIFGSQLRRL
tara:strand:+ start:19922 stop:20356 length:435 start_codon:yes stop_codon:yes gene_type:complete